MSNGHEEAPHGLGSTVIAQHLAERARDKDRALAQAKVLSELREQLKLAEEVRDLARAECNRLLEENRRLRDAIEEDRGERILIGDPLTRCALLEVATERVRQERLKADGKFALTCADLEMTDFEACAVLGEEFGEVCHEVNETIGQKSENWEVRSPGDCDSEEEFYAEDAVRDERRKYRARLRTELVQVAAVAVAWVEKLDKESAK